MAEGASPGPKAARFARKVAIVTGGASGIGAAFVRRVHGEGGAVMIADLDRERGEAMASELGERAAFAAVDVAHDGQVALFELGGRARPDDGGSYVVKRLRCDHDRTALHSIKPKKPTMPCWQRSCSNKRSKPTLIRSCKKSGVTKAQPTTPWSLTAPAAIAMPSRSNVRPRRRHRAAASSRATIHTGTEAQRHRGRG